MPKFAEEFYIELRLKIRKLLQLRPKTTAKEVAKMFDIAYKVGWRELKKVRRQIIEDLRQSTQDSDLSELAEFLWQAKPEIKRILFDKDEQGNYKYSAKERIWAFEAVLKGDERAINIKMDLGVYQRNLGKIQIEPKLSDESQKILEKALNYATERAEKTRTGKDKPRHTTKKENG